MSRDQRRKSLLELAQRRRCWASSRWSRSGLLGRAVYLQVLDKQFLLDQGDERHLRVVEMPAHRGMILDRNGQPLAVSTPVDSIWMNPQEFSTAARPPPLAKVLGIHSRHDLMALLRQNHDKEFVYLARGLDPYAAQQADGAGYARCLHPARISPLLSRR